MKTSINWNSQITLLSVPLAMMISLVLLAKSSFFLSNPQTLSSAITLDFALTIPLFYLFLIRKKDIPKITIASVFIVGIIVATWVIPAMHQSLLQQIKIFVFPIVEMGVLGYIILKTYQTLQRFRIEKNANPDFYTALKAACVEILPQKIAPFLSTEIAVVYYSLFHWKKRELAANEFSYYKKSGIRLLAATFIFLIFIEAFAIHLILQLWSHTAAWILTGLSLYACLQVFALIRSMSKRPIWVDIAGGKLFLRYGFFSETTILLKDIEGLELSTKPLPIDNNILQFSPLGHLDKHNIILHVNSENILQRIYGMQNSYKSIAIYVDEREKFVETIRQTLK